MRISFARRRNGPTTWRAFASSWLEGPTDPNAADDSARVPLSLAAVRDNRHIVRELFAAGARLHGSVFAGPDGLAWAARLAQPETVATLLEMGADPNVYDAEGFTPLLRVAYHEASFPFVSAHAPTYATIAELLLARGADPELPNVSRVENPCCTRRWVRMTYMDQRRWRSHPATAPTASSQYSLGVGRVCRRPER